MNESYIKSHPGGGMSFVGRAAVNIYAALSLASGLRLYAKTRMKPNRAWTLKNMLAQAEVLTGKKFKRSQVLEAADALTAWAKEQQSTLGSSNVITLRAPR